jgi:hypothetical protein
MKKVGFIDYFLDEWHAENYPNWIKEASNGEYVVSYCWGEIDSPKPGGRTNREWAEFHGIELCSSIEEVIGKSDVLCVLAPDNPETHLRLTKLPLMSGKRTYIDKTFAPDKDTAIKIFETSYLHNTPCFTSSALRFADEYIQAEKSGISGITSIGGGNYENYCIHQIEPIVMLLGSDAKRVKAIGTPGLPSFLIEFEGDVSAIISCFNPGCPFQMVINYSDGSCRVLDIKSDFFKNFIRELIRFYESGEIVVPHEQTIAVMAIREACLKAYRLTDQWIQV